MLQSHQALRLVAKLRFPIGCQPNARKLCEQAAGSRRGSFKQQLFALYKLVHPDLFSAFPAEKAENERSLKLLQEYISRSESSDGRSLAYSTSYPFVFFLKDNPAAEGSHTPSKTLGPQLRRVALTLPPPSPTLVEGHLSLAGRKGLSRLLQACGLPELDLSEEDGSGPLSTRLVPFLTEAAEEARLLERDAVQTGVRMANVRGALRYGRKVLVTVANKRLDPERSSALLESVARVLDRLPLLDVSGLRICLAERTGISPSGQLLLDVEDGEEEWGDFLDQVDLLYCRQLQDRLEAVKQLELLVAKAVGVSMIYTTPHCLLDADYRTLLERLSAHAAQRGPAKAAGLQEVPVMVVPPTGSADSPITDATAEQHVDADLGYIRLAMSCDAQAAYHILQEYGAAASKILQRNHSQQQYEALLTTNTRKMLKLRRLARDESAVTHSQYEAACKRLMQHRVDLADLLDGQSVRISRANRVLQDGSGIDIAWNFEP